MMNKVPNGWSLSIVDDLFDVQLGKMLNQEAKAKYPQFAYLTNFNVRWGSFSTDNFNTMYFSEKERLKFSLQHGDLIMCEGGEVGRCAIWENQVTPCYFQKALHRLRSKGEIIPKYFQLYMVFISDKKLLEDYISRTSIAHLTREKLLTLPVKLPPLPEQIKIAEILSTWDNAINTVQKLLSNSQQQKKALMQQLLTGKKRFVGFEGEWEVYLLEDLESMGWVELGRGNVISKKDIEKKQGLYPIYSSSVKNLGLMGFYDEFMFDEELISWSIDGGGNFFYRPKHKFSVTNVSGYMRLDGTKLSYRFMANQLELLHSKLEFDYQSKAHPSVIRKLYKIYLPELQEQQKIAAILTIADQEIDNLRAQLNHLKQEKKALMQQLLTGKRRVKIEEVA